jgi:hypothetical protein
MAGLAAAFPLRVQLDLGHGSFPLILDGSALAKGDNGGGTVTVVETGMAAPMVTAVVRVTAATAGVKATVVQAEAAEATREAGTAGLCCINFVRHNPWCVRRSKQLLHPVA